jgi:acetyl-CoA C-acetyltransferase
MSMTSSHKALLSRYDNVFLLDGVRTPFVDYNTALGLVSPTDLGIKAAREVFRRSAVSSADVDIVVAGNMAQASFDAYVLPRHIGLYSGVPIEVPAHLVQRVCGTGFEAILQAADLIKLAKADLALVVGTESMSRNPIAAYTHRGGFRMGEVEFKDFLWEALLDPCPNETMGGTAEKLAKQYDITRADVDQFAAESFARAIEAQKSCFLSGEIAPLANEVFELAGYSPRGIQLPRGVEKLSTDTHIRPSPLEVLSRLKPAFGGVQTGGNSSGIVDGAAATLVASGEYLKKHGRVPLARVVAGAAVGVRPEIMGIGPVVAIPKALAMAGLMLDDIDVIELNEAFAVQALSVIRVGGLDPQKVNPNGGAIALGHPLGCTGAKLTASILREMQRRGARYGMVTMCVGGGQGAAGIFERL